MRLAILPFVVFVLGQLPLAIGQSAPSEKKAEDRPKTNSPDVAKSPKAEAKKSNPANNQNPPPVRRTDLETEDYYTIFALFVAILVGAIGVTIAQRKLKQSREEETSASDQLAEFRRLNAAGELSNEEFARIKLILGEKIRKEAGVPLPGDAGKMREKTPARPTPGSADDPLSTQVEDLDEDVIQKTVDESSEQEHEGDIEISDDSEDQPAG